MYIHTSIHRARKSTSNNSSCAPRPSFSDGTYGIPSDESSRHFHNIELDARRRTSYVQTNNSPSMSFKGCLPSSAYRSDREAQGRTRAPTAFACGDVHISSERDASNRTLDSRITSRAISACNRAYCCLAAVISTMKDAIYFVPLAPASRNALSMILRRDYSPEKAISPIIDRVVEHLIRGRIIISRQIDERSNGNRGFCGRREKQPRIHSLSLSL